MNSTSGSNGEAEVGNARPILYSFRRCPYAMRARIAINYASQAVELREVVLKDKPAEMIAASAKATVPVLVDGECVIDESLEIMQWALEQSDPDNWLAVCDGNLLSNDLVKRNDTEFKPILDRYKYFDRHPEASQDDYLEQAKPFLLELDQRISVNDGYLSTAAFTATDAAILPFIRQFANSDLSRFDALDLVHLSGWLSKGLASPLFTEVMSKYPAWSAAQNNSVSFGA